MKSFLRVPANGYLLAVVATVLVLLVRGAILGPVLEWREPIILFVLPVLLAAWQSGLKAGLFATVLAAASCDFFIVEPRFSFAISDIRDALRLILVVMVGVAVSWVCEAMHDYRRRLCRQADLLDHAADALFAWELSGLIVYWNLGAERLYGYTREQVLGRVGHELLGTTFPVPFRVIQETLERDSEWRGELSHTTHGGGVVTVESRMVLVKEPDGHKLVLQANRDVTQRRAEQDRLKTSEERLRLAVEALQEAGHRKDEFLATLAHELRNPLAPIRNSLQILRLAGDDCAARERALAMMERQVAQMVHLVDDLLDVSRISRGKIALRQEPVDLATVIHQAVEASRPLVEAAGLDLATSLPSLPIALHADATRLVQVFSNLLNNACKFTERGGRITLSAERVDGRVAVRVRDTGVGIPREMLSRIFEMFVQADTTLERSQGGLGIGLTLTKRLVEMHGGEVTVESEGPGKGSEFAVRLPVQEAPQAIASSRADAPRRGAAALSALVVDDNADAAESLALILGMLGHDVSAAYDGPSALEAVEARRPDVVLCDLGMPGMSGYEVARRLRDRYGAAGPVLIALTGYGSDADRQRSREAGFDYHLVKPVEIGDLEQLLGTLTAAKGGAAC